MRPWLSALCMVADWNLSTNAVCTRRHQYATFHGHHASVELRGGLVVVYEASDNENVIEAASIDTFKRHEFDFLREVVSTAEWRSLCDDPSRCRICMLPNELSRRHSSAEEFLRMPLDDDVSSTPSSHIVEPMATIPMSISRQQRSDVSESLEAESSSAPTFQRPIQHRLRSKNTKPKKESATKAKSTTRKKKSTASPKSDVLTSKEPTRQMDEDGPEKALHQAVFDYITNKPPEAWMAVISRHTNRKLSTVENYFQNRRDQLESVLFRKEPDWKFFYKNVNFELPDGSVVHMRPSALENWPSVRWTDEDFGRIIKEDFLPHIAYIKKQNDKKRVTIPFYANRSRRFPDDETRMDEGEDVEETGKHVRLFKFALAL